MISPKARGQRGGWGGYQSINQQGWSEPFHIFYLSWDIHLHSQTLVLVTLELSESDQDCLCSLIIKSTAEGIPVGMRTHRAWVCGLACRSSAPSAQVHWAGQHGRDANLEPTGVLRMASQLFRTTWVRGYRELCHQHCGTKLKLCILRTSFSPGVK